ncbi:MAG TPA: Rrf2 family transcriptional regulator [Candidatus Binataceae bacterium]|nr:Rrf2 family transcriptional regulator [Candidatus Binataceae bacterium]
MLSHKSKYALKAALVLAKEYGQGPVLISDIAQREAIPRKFLELILLELRNRGVLQSKKGKGGGYFLGRPPSKVTLGEILRDTEGPLAPIGCVSQFAYVRCEDCRDERTCGIRMVMKDVRDATARILDSTTLADVLKRVETTVSGASQRPHKLPAEFA